MFEILILVVIAAALLLPCIKRLDISEMKVFRVPFEIPVLVLFFLMAADVFWMTGSVVYSTVEGSRLSSGPGMLMNVLMWMCVFWHFLLGVHVPCGRSYA